MAIQETTTTIGTPWPMPATEDADEHRGTEAEIPAVTHMEEADHLTEDPRGAGDLMPRV